MILQKLVFQKQSEETKTLYYRSRNGQTRQTDDGLVLPQGTGLDLGTYFNAFSAFKWKRYTKVSAVYVTLKYKGNMKLELWHVKKSRDAVTECCLLERSLCSEGQTIYRSDTIPLPEEGMLTIVLRAEKETVLYGGAYETPEEPARHDVRIGISICTYKREPFVERNLELLKKELLYQKESPAYGKVQVCISDNAGTLDQKRLQDEHIRIVKNKNLGGVGGFTRGMLENIEAEESLTHILLMDDDVVIPRGAIERMYVYLTLLKPQYLEYMLGGALMRLDTPWIQYESGAIWNDGDMIANHHNLDMREIKNCLVNDEESRQDYVGWWYACIPVSLIREIKLPIPMFLHRDDIEYGLRANGKFLFLNGVCVWHEAFENKCPGVTEYYDVRNLAILNAIHEPEFSAWNFKKMLFKQVCSNIGKYRYQYVDLNLLGAIDFLRGFNWFYYQDTLAIHKRIADYNYKMVDAKEYVGYKGLNLQDLNPYIEGQDDKGKPANLVRYWKIATLNGHFFPAKKGKPKVAIPNPNIYDLYRCKEVIFVDNAGKALYVRRSIREMICCFAKVLHVCRLVDKRYEIVCEKYRKNYHKLITAEYWKKYLAIEKL